MNQTSTRHTPYFPLVLFLACVSLPCPAAAEDSETFKAYLANWQKAQQAYADGNFAVAASYYEKVAGLLPYEPSSRFQLACCRARTGDRQGAVSALEAAIRYGWDDPARLEQAEDLKGLRDDSRFADLLKNAAVCRDETVILYRGKSVAPNRPTPLVVLLQGLGCGPRGEVPYWKPVADQLGLVLVAPRGVTKAGSMLYGWHRAGARDSRAADYFDMAAATKHIDDAVALAGKKFEIDKQRIVLAGFSQGGGVALRLLADRPDRYCGAVAVCGLLQSPDVVRWKELIKQRPVRVFVMAGKLDRLLPRSQDAVMQLRAAGLMVQYEELEGTGHEYPTDHTGRLRKALAYVLDRQESTP